LGGILGSASPPVPCLSLPFNLTAVAATLMLTFRNEQPGMHSPLPPPPPINISHNHPVEMESTDEVDLALVFLCNFRNIFTDTEKQR